MNEHVESRRRCLALPAIAAVLLLAGCGQQDEPAPAVPRLVFAQQVADASGLGERAFPGRARAGQQVNLSFRVSGPLIALPVSVGDVVREGDVVARIDPRDFESAVNAMRAQVEREEARARRAAADHRRLQNVMREDPGATSEAALDRARQTRDSSAASVRALQASLTTALDQLAYTELKAPFDGVVVETYVDNFETVVAKQPVVRLLDPSRIEFVINVPESLIGLAPHVESIEVAFDALAGLKVPAAIKEVGQEASQATRTYPVTLVMEQPEGAELLPGMAGQARITARVPGAGGAGFDLPATAVFTDTDGRGSYVWVIDEASKRLGRREVEVGELTRFGVRIRSGLAAGEWVVTKGVHSVSEGEPVRIMDAGGDRRAS